MAKKVRAIVKLAITGGKANPAPPVGPALGATGINIMAFCKEYNERTAANVGMIIPVEITVFSDRSFTFVTRTPPAADLLRKAAGLEKGGATTGRETVGRVTRDQIRDIAQTKLPDLNAVDLDGAARIVEGTARSMGIEVVS